MNKQIAQGENLLAYHLPEIDSAPVKHTLLRTRAAKKTISPKIKVCKSQASRESARLPTSDLILLQKEGKCKHQG